MSRLYLITGFLGAGKTTFLKNFIRLFEGQRIQLIVNEFGREGVDGALLAELGAYLKEIAGGSVFCACRMDQFEKALKQSADYNADVILVEASGMSDPTGVRRLFEQSGRFPGIDYRGAVCMVDAVRFPKLYATARTCVKQLAASDVVVVNKLDKATPEQLTQTLGLIRGQRPDMPLVTTSFGEVDAALLDALEGARAIGREDMPLTADVSLKRLMVLVDATISPYELLKFIEMFAEYTFRVKGFVATCEGMHLADCVGNVVSVKPCGQIEVPRRSVGWLTVLSGAGMPVRKAVKEAAGWYAEQILAIE